MRVLYILKHNPWGIGGGCYACRNYLDAFVEVFKGADFDVCICEEYLKDNDGSFQGNVNFVGVKPRGLFAKLLSPLTGIMHRHQIVVQRLIKHCHYDYCVFDESGIAGSLVEVAKRQGVKTIVINHNYQVEYSRDNMTSVFERLLILPVVGRCERRSYLKCDFNIFLTEEDKATFGEVYGDSATKSIVGGCFLKKSEAINVDASSCFNKENLKMVISGTIGNVQNLDGINYFLDDLFQYVPDNVEVVITGKNPPDNLIERVGKMDRRIKLLPNPLDIDAIVRDCDIFLCTTRLGGGMKLRLMDGFRNGLPVLTHKISARGYSRFEKEGVMRVFDDEVSFRNGLCDLIDSIGSGRIKRSDVARIASEQFDFGNAVARINM